MLLEVFGFITGLIYLYLEIKQNKFMWAVGAICAAAYIIIFYNSGLYASMGMQAYYVFMGFYGWFEWLRLKMQASSGKKHYDNSDGSDKLCYKGIDWRISLISFGVFFILYFVIYYLLKQFDNNTMPYLDAFGAALSIVATWWLGKCIIYQWWLWVVADIVIAVMSFSNDMVLSGCLYLLYSLFAVYGFYFWKKSGIKL